MTLTALVGATGGAGTTRTAVELATVLARDGARVAVIDTAYATQGLAAYVEGRITTDVTALTLNPDRALTEATYELVGPDAFPDRSGANDESEQEPAAEHGSSNSHAPHDTSGDAGRVVAVPAAAAFEQFARAKSRAASERLETRLAAAADRFDHVLCDVPPVGSNPHVACVTTADRRVAVTPGTPHGADARRRLADRLADLDCSLDATCAIGESIPAADATIPEGPTAVADAPVAVTDSGFTERVVAAVEPTLGVACDVTCESNGPLDRVRNVIE